MLASHSTSSMYYTHMKKSIHEISKYMMRMYVYFIWNWSCDKCSTTDGTTGTPNETHSVNLEFLLSILLMLQDRMKEHRVLILEKSWEMSDSDIVWNSRLGVCIRYVQYPLDEFNNKSCCRSPSVRENSCMLYNVHSHSPTRVRTADVLQPMWLGNKKKWT